MTPDLKLHYTTLYICRNIEKNTNIQTNAKNMPTNLIKKVTIKQVRNKHKARRSRGEHIGRVIKGEHIGVIVT